MHTKIHLTNVDFVEKLEVKRNKGVTFKIGIGIGTNKCSVT